MDINKKHINWKKLILTILEDYALTQIQLATELGTTPQSISNWLSGRNIPREKFINKLLIKKELLKQIKISNSELFTNLKTRKLSRQEIKFWMKINKLKKDKNTILNFINDYINFATKNHR